MQIRRLLALAVIGFSLTAAADFRTVTEVHELWLSNVRLPATTSGTLSFSECAECQVVTLRASAATRYAVNGKTVSLVDFRKAIAGVSNRNDQMVDVFHHLDTNTVTAVEIKL